MYRLVSAIASGFLAMLLLAPSVAASRQIEAQDIKRAERSLASFAAETGMMLDQVQRGGVTDTYAKEHLGKLKEAVGDIRRDLVGPVGPSVQSRRDRAARFVEILDADLSNMAANLHDQDTQHRVRSDIVRLQAELKE